MHPILESNLLSVWPHIDVDNLPPEFAEFTRLPPPELGPYDHAVSTYISDSSGGYTDSWSTSPYTEEERQIEIQQVKDDWNGMAGTPKSWTFVEENCRFEAPIPHPTNYEGPVTYLWDEESYQVDNTSGWV
jgi:hypothetical protein